VLADKWGVPKLQNEVIDRLAIEAKTEVIPGSTMTYIYDNTLPSSMLRGIALDICAWNMSKPTFQNYNSKYPSEFWQDLCGAIFEKQAKDEEDGYVRDPYGRNNFKKRKDYYVTGGNTRAYPLLS
jgi:hypothetical protein